MKKNFVFLVMVGILIINLFVPKELVAQEPKRLKLFSKSLSEEKVPLSVGFIYGSEGPGVDVWLHFPNSVIPGLFTGVELTEKAQLGAIVGCEPVQIFKRVNFVTGLQWQYRLKIIATNNHLTSETFSGEEEMIISARLGLIGQVGRFGVGIYYNPGQQFLPSNTTKKQNWKWSQNAAIALHVKL